MKQAEKQFMDAVIQWAELNGWLVYHTYDSRHSQKGFPDLVMVRKGVLVFAELKASSDVGVTPEQHVWLQELAAVGHPDHRIHAYVWRPEDWPEVEAVLKRVV